MINDRVANRALNRGMNIQNKMVFLNIFRFINLVFFERTGPIKVNVIKDVKGMGIDRFDATSIINAVAKDMDVYVLMV